MSDAQSITTSIGDGRAPKARRNRTGCLVCRSRRIKCSEDKPECQQCVRHNAECAYPAKLAFSSGDNSAALARRHVRTRKSKPPHGDTSPLGPASVQQDISSDFASISASITRQNEEPRSMGVPNFPDQALAILTAMCRRTRMGSFYSDPVPPPDFLRMEFPVEADLQCMHHCLTYSMSLMVVEEEGNPWVRAVAPLMLFSNGFAPASTMAIRNAMLAMGANHLRFLRQSVHPEMYNYGEDFPDYAQDALQGIRLASRTESMSDTFLAAVVLFISHAVFSGHSGWREIFRHAIRAIRDRGGPERVLFGDGMTQPTAVLRCVMEQLAITDLYASLEIGEPPSVLTRNNAWWDRLGCGGQDDYENRSVERSFGVHRGLVAIAADVTRLLSDRLRTHRLYGMYTVPAPDDLLVHASSLAIEMTMAYGGLAAETEKLRQDLSSWHDSLQHDISAMSKRTEIGSLALWHACNILLVDGDGDGATAVAECEMRAREILELCARVGDKVEYMNWPLLIASSVLSLPADRARSRAILDAFRYQCCYEIDKIGAVVEECWRRMDEGVERDEGGASCRWREVMWEMGGSVLIG